MHTSARNQAPSRTQTAEQRRAKPQSDEDLIAKLMEHSQSPGFCSQEKYLILTKESEIPF